MKRIVALDVGTVRIGVAASDPLGSFAQGVAVLQAAGSWMEELAGIVGEYRAEVLLVGMPRRTDGTDGPEAGRMRKTVEKLRARFPEMVVVEWDERFTTTIAQQTLLEADVSRKGRKGQVDKVAATILLQGYLDAQRAKEEESKPIVTSQEMFPLPSFEDDRRGRGKGKNRRAYD